MGGRLFNGERQNARHAGRRFHRRRPDWLQLAGQRELRSRDGSGLSRRRGQRRQRDQYEPSSRANGRAQLLDGSSASKGLDYLGTIRGRVGYL